MIVKLQRPLASSESDPPWLVYNQARSFRQFLSKNSLPAHVQKAMKDRDKGYFEITTLPTGKVASWGRIMPDRPW
jgi:hypothetical protein